MAPSSKSSRTAARLRLVPKRRLATDSFTRAQKNKLLELRDVMVDSMSSAANRTPHDRASGNEMSAFVGDLADAGGNRSERDFAMILLSQERDALAQIDHALKRIEAGTYGVCEMSGQLIPRARLEAIPFARYTVDCQAQFEKQRKAAKSFPRVPSLFEVDAEERDEEEMASLARKRTLSLAQGISILEVAPE